MLPASLCLLLSLVVIFLLLPLVTTVCFYYWFLPILILLFCHGHCHFCCTYSHSNCYLFPLLFLLSILSTSSVTLNFCHLYYCHSLPHSLRLLLPTIIIIIAAIIFYYSYNHCLSLFLPLFLWYIFLSFFLSFLRILSILLSVLLPISIIPILALETFPRYLWPGLRCLCHPGFHPQEFFRAFVCTQISSTIDSSSKVWFLFFVIFDSFLDRSWTAISN